MDETETRTAVTYLNQDWAGFREPPGGGGAEAVPGGPPAIDPRYAHQDRVPYWPRGEPRPVVTDHQGWARTRFLGATAVGSAIAVAFQWPSDEAAARTYLPVTDVTGWDVDDRLTSSVLQARVAELLATPAWTTTRCHPVSDRLALVLS
ncbi:hypothetical protein [Amycolatopsis sp. NPDC051903]|uniref:hypothetical protein n=1 Tax=Amycolatopsis sp. NPDC051903 TaxID=3363936 RepID=UPI0037AA6AF7